VARGVWQTGAAAYDALSPSCSPIAARTRRVHRRTSAHLRLSRTLLSYVAISSLNVRRTSTEQRDARASAKLFAYTSSPTSTGRFRLIVDAQYAQRCLQSHARRNGERGTHSAAGRIVTRDPVAPCGIYMPCTLFIPAGARHKDIRRRPAGQTDADGRTALLYALMRQRMRSPFLFPSTSLHAGRISLLSTAFALARWRGRVEQGLLFLFFLGPPSS